MNTRKRKHSSGVGSVGGGGGDDSESSPVLDPRKSIRDSSKEEENEKLKDKISVMRHHLCLLEFGLGSIATLLLEVVDKSREDVNDVRSSSISTSRNFSTSASCTTAPASSVSSSSLPGASIKGNVEEGLRGEEESVGTTTSSSSSSPPCGNESCDRYRKLVMGIGGVLADVETALKSASAASTLSPSSTTAAASAVADSAKVKTDEDGKDSAPSSSSSSSSTTTSNAFVELRRRCNKRTHGIGGDDDKDSGRNFLESQMKKDRIYIDEVGTGENVLTGVCNIQIVENNRNSSSNNNSNAALPQKGNPNNNAFDFGNGKKKNNNSSMIELELEALSTLASLAAASSSSSSASNNTATTTTTTAAKSGGTAAAAEPLHLQPRTRRGRPRQWKNRELAFN